MLLEYAFGAGLVAFGLMHLAWVFPDPPGLVNYPFSMCSPRFGEIIEASTAHALGMTAAIVAGASFVLAGANVSGAFAPPEATRVALILGAACSVDLMTLYWRTWFVAFVVVDLGLLLIAIAAWPT